jgi:hypothetical protein
VLPKVREGGVFAPVIYQCFRLQVRSLFAGFILRHWLRCSVRARGPPKMLRTSVFRPPKSSFVFWAAPLGLGDSNIIYPVLPPGRSRRRSRTPPIFGPTAPAAARAPAAYLAAAPRVPRRCPPVHVPNNVPHRYLHPVDASASRCRAPALPSDRLSGPDVFRRWGSSCNEGRLE